MKLKDIQAMEAAGLISAEQGARIVEFFKLEQPRNLLLKVLSMLGAVLVAVGVVLAISANWDAIPGLVKIAGGALLMAGMHWGGWLMRERNPKTSEAFHFAGAALFLANIGLVGQVYHLSARSPNALLLWLVGIAPLVALLRLPSIHVLGLSGLMVWLGMEINAKDGVFHFASHVGQFGVYASVGLLLYGAGLMLKRGTFGALAGVTEVFGMVVMHLSMWPLVATDSDETTSLILMIVPGVVGLALVMAALRREERLPRQWRGAWVAALASWIGTAAAWLFLDFNESGLAIMGRMGWGEGLALIAMVAGCLVQIRVAEELRAPWMVNLGIASMGVCIFIAFVLLVGTMMNTAIIFLVGGAGILGLGFWLERKRRAVMGRMNA